MKKRIIISGLCLAVAVCGIGVYASGLGETIMSKLSGNRQVNIDEYAAAVESENAERENAISEALKNAGVQDVLVDGSAADTMDKYSQMLIAMDATIFDPIEYNDLLVNYEYLREVRGLSQDDMDYIADLIIAGCDMKEILNLTYFWVDTNDDISIIKSMYDLKGEYEGKKDWYGNAYDRVTNAKNGSLSVEEVEEYMSKGLTAEDILAADKLCRKGVYTINQILDKLCDGESMLSVANEIEGGELACTYTAATVDVLEDKEISNTDIVKCDEAAALLGEDQAEVIKRAKTGESINEILVSKSNEKYAEIRRALQERGLLKTEKGVE